MYEKEVTGDGHPGDVAPHLPVMRPSSADLRLLNILINAVRPLAWPVDVD